ncbi:uncharacterized protein Z519_09533 [Cladophialophora bantiana CBS 173.52]|uniref:Cytochrome b5 heme-binding domain-containing protein n=1 Tax=Cladophialophora bantiana (strain ATCC 10958 / CBS 173.52 / CDC B-1940 / NIH 8579) TaxID=1442370 RepID=A0A0D2FU85_CLAB1|nr:uncharacterized protein Z519_09533 [Cladophialophora bantiana CBS 173.52]KIW90102.1 hypothetical protein Z519_09533 [Cladophialophora bantiana CBS 173.52]
MSFSAKPHVPVHELNGHATAKNSWTGLNGTVLGFSNYAAQQPGGGEVIVQHLGKDGSDVYNKIHSPALVQRRFGKQRRIGKLKTSDSPMTATNQTNKEGSNKQQHNSLSPLKSITSLNQFEAAASPALTRYALLYLSGATEDGITERANRNVYNRVLFRRTCP